MLVEPVYEIDPNGIPIKPGYRKPFTSETGRAAVLKSQAALKPAKALLTALKLKSGPLQAMLTTYRRAIRRHTQASISETDARLALHHAKAAKMYHDMEQSLLNPRHNSTKNHGLRKSGAIAPIQPIAPVETMPSGGLLDSTVESVATPLKSIESTKPSPEIEDDCPF